MTRAREGGGAKAVLSRGNWSFSNLPTTVRIMLMCYIDCYSFSSIPKKIG